MLSYCRGPEQPVIGHTVWQAFEATALRFPDRLALIARHDELRLPFSLLRERALATARGLAGLGLRPGDRAGIWASNCAEWLLLQLACARTGIVLVNVNPAYRSHELGFVLRKSRMKALFLRERDARANYREILERARAGSPLEHVVHLGAPSWDEMIAGGRDLPPQHPGPDDVTNIQYTSGTTGAPKGVLLTHRNVLNNGWLIAQSMKITEEDRICVPVPMYHCFGCVMAAMVCYLTGARLILPSPQFDALAALQAIHEERATALYGVPTMFIAQLGHSEFDRFDLRSLRTGVMAGAPCPIEVMRQVVGRMHCREITIAYGQTESSPVITMSSVDDPLELRVSTVGRPLSNTEVKIVSPETGETAPAGEQGELCTRGYLVMKGYDDEPEATRKAIDDDGWLHTGDLAVMRPDGCFRITGRAKDMIIRGGENIYPREIEEFLYTHPKIAEVQVVGLPDERLGEIVAAWVKLRAGEETDEEEIQAYCRGKIAHFKIPQHVRIVDSFPMTVTGKVQKFQMREIEIRERGLDAVSRIQTA